MNEKIQDEGKLREPLTFRDNIRLKFRALRNKSGLLGNELLDERDLQSD